MEVRMKNQKSVYDEIVRIGLDLAKSVFQIHGVNKNNKCILRKKIKRNEMLAFFANLKPCLIGMEACGGSHYWARKFTSMGHTVKIMAAKYVKPFVINNKNDAKDAEAICEAVNRPNIYSVSVKTIEQHDLQAYHRIRELVKKNRTALANQMRGILTEYGIVVKRGISHIRNAVPITLEDADNELTIITREFMLDLYNELITFINAQSISIPACKRLMEIEGVGPLTATALFCAVGNGHQFKKGRDMSAWIGLVPKHHSSGGKSNLLGISKRGNTYLRTLLVHGGRAVVQNCDKKDDPLSKWLSNIKTKKGANCACVARANKVARIAWAILSKEEKYKKAA